MMGPALFIGFTHSKMCLQPEQKHSDAGLLLLVTAGIVYDSVHVFLRKEFFHFQDIQQTKTE